MVERAQSQFKAIQEMTEKLKLEASAFGLSQIENDPFVAKME